MIYLDNSATSRKKPLIMLFTLLKETAISANAGRGGHKASIKTALKMEKTREIIKKYFFDGKVIFTKNCTEALNLAIVGSNLSGRVVTTVFEHNSVLRTLKKLENENKIKLTVISPKDGDFYTPLSSALGSDVSMVVVTAKSNVTGQKTDVGKLTKLVKEKTNALTVVDVAQSAGHDDVDYSHSDMICSSGHKGLLGSQGTGFLLVKKNVKLFPLITGGTGTSSNKLEIPIEIPEGMETGTQNSAGVISLGKSIEYAFRNKNRINNKVNILRKTLLDGIKKEKKIKLYSHNDEIVLLNVKGMDSNYLADILSSEFGICVRGGLHCAPLMHEYLGTAKTGAVRISFGDNNNRMQIKRVVYALKKIARNQTSKNMINERG